jgi:hypothetical protein
MNRPTFRASIFIASLLTTSAVSAGADIVKCVDSKGRVTVTDGQCSEGIQTLLVAGSADGPAGNSADTPAADMANTANTTDAPAPPLPATHGVPIERIVLTPAQFPPSSWSAPHTATRMLSRDVETLKAARASLHALDEAAAAMRHHRLADLN